MSNFFLVNNNGGNNCDYFIVFCLDDIELENYDEYQFLLEQLIHPVENSESPIDDYFLSVGMPFFERLLHQVVFS